jgi:hypothetical protein
MSTEHATRTTTSGRDAVLLRQIAVVIPVERMVPTLVGGIDFIHYSDRWIFLGLHIDDGINLQNEVSRRSMAHWKERGGLGPRP